MELRRLWLVGCVAAVAAGWVASCGGEIFTVSGSSTSSGSTSSGSTSSGSSSTSSGSSSTNSGSSSTSSSSSSTSSSGTSTSSSSSSTSSSSGAGAQPPAPGLGQVPDGTATLTFAISELFLGDTDPDGTPDPTNGWESFGYDVDRTISTATSTNLCQTADGASRANVYPDGHAGIDNSFGKLILPMFLSLSSNYSSMLNTAIASGSFTQLISIDMLGAGTSYNPITSQVALGAYLMGTPKFDGTDVWPVTQGSAVSLPQAYVVGNTWVSGSAASVTLPLLFVTTSFPVQINHAVITMQLDAAHQNATLGVISGVISTAQLTEQFMLAAGSVDSSLCSGPTIQSILRQITEASDILQDGTQDPTKTCDGISIGLGFNASRVLLGPTVPPPAPAPNPCADAGE